jgi:hypothetical protein
MTMPKVEHRPHVRDGIARWMALPKEAQDADIAWAAGLFDGEGSIGTMQSDQRYRQRITLRVVMTSRFGIERMHRIFPYSPIRTAPARGVRLPVFIWSCTHIGYVTYVLLMLQRHLTVKRQEAELALQYLANLSPTAQDNAVIVTALRACKSKPGQQREAA